MNNKIVALVLTIASVGASYAPAMAAKSPAPGKTVAVAKATAAKPGVARKVNKGFCKNVIKPAAAKTTK